MAKLYPGSFHDPDTDSLPDTTTNVADMLDFVAGACDGADRDLSRMWDKECGAVLRARRRLADPWGPAAGETYPKIEAGADIGTRVDYLRSQILDLLSQATPRHRQCLVSYQTSAARSSAGRRTG